MMEYEFACRLLEMHTRQLLDELNALHTASGYSKKIAMAQMNCVICSMHPSLLLGRDNGKLIGCGILTYSETLFETQGIIQNLIVLPSYKRKGIKKVLHAKLVETAVARGATEIILI